MSEVYNCLVIPQPLHTVAAVYHETAYSDVPYEFERVNADVTLMYHQAPRDDYRFAEEMDEIAVGLSTRLGAVLVFEYDSRVGHRASRVYKDGELTATFGEADELWVPLDEQGYPILTADRLHTGELLNDVEYETVENAINLGLKTVGAGDWSDLHDFLDEL
jgi:hypothetical protein